MTSVTPTGSTPNVSSAFVVTSAMLATHNIQGLIELAYVGTGNQVMNSALQSLDQALTSTQGALNSLSALQTLHNAVTIASSQSFNFPLDASSATVTLTSYFDGAVTDTVSTSDPGSAGVTVNATSQFTINTATTTQTATDYSFTRSLIAGQSNISSTFSDFSDFTNASTALYAVDTLATIGTGSAIGATFSGGVSTTTSMAFSITTFDSIAANGDVIFTTNSPFGNATYTIASNGNISRDNAGGTGVGTTLVFGLGSGAVMTGNSFLSTTVPDPTLTLNTFQTYTTSYNTPDGYQAIYKEAASTYFGNPIAPTFAVTTAGVTTNIVSAGQSAFITFAAQLMSTRAQISAIIAQLSAVTLNKSGDPTTLYHNLKTVYNEIPSNTSYSAVSHWVLDGYSNTSGTKQANAGGIQNDLTTAITAAESLNSAQTQAVQNYLFVFQEYYQSASAILTALTQIFQSMSKNISQ